MKLDICIYGNPALRVKAKPVEQVTDKIRKLVADMLETMHAANGIGLAAEQIGRREAVLVIDTSPIQQDENESTESTLPRPPMPLIMINPEITKEEGEQTGSEGCLSFPELYTKITRADRVTACFLDTEGNTQTITTDGLLARAIQHEMDHLNGVLLVDRMSPVQKAVMAGKLKRLRKQGRR